VWPIISCLNDSFLFERFKLNFHLIWIQLSMWNECVNKALNYLVANGNLVIVEQVKCESRILYSGFSCSSSFTAHFYSWFGWTRLTIILLLSITNNYYYRYSRPTKTLSCWHIRLVLVLNQWRQEGRGIVFRWILKWICKDRFKMRNVIIFLFRGLYK